MNSNTIFPLKKRLVKLTFVYLFVLSNFCLLAQNNFIENHSKNLTNAILNSDEVKWQHLMSSIDSTLIGIYKHRNLYYIENLKKKENYISHFKKGLTAKRQDCFLKEYNYIYKSLGPTISDYKIEKVFQKKYINYKENYNKVFNLKEFISATILKNKNNGKKFILLSKMEFFDLNLHELSGADKYKNIALKSFKTTKIISIDEEKSNFVDEDFIVEVAEDEDEDDEDYEEEFEDDEEEKINEVEIVKNESNKDELNEGSNSLEPNLNALIDEYMCYVNTSLRTYYNANISADKMNVVYRGLKNPFTIYVPGVSLNSFAAYGQGIRKVDPGKFEVSPRYGDSLNIRISYKSKNGLPVLTRTVFKIKDIPTAFGSIRHKYGTISLPKLSIAKVVVNAGLPDFLFDVKLKVLSFTIKVPGNVPVKVNGTRMNAEAKKAIAKVKNGDHITIYNIKATMYGESVVERRPFFSEGEIIPNNVKGVRIRKVLPIIIKVL